jgi:hypothetical protein
MEVKKDLDAIKAFITAKMPTPKEEIAHQILGTMDTTIVGEPDADTETDYAGAPKLPLHLKNNPFVGVPEAPVVEIEFSEVCDSDHPNRGKVIISEDHASAIAYLPEGLHIKKINHKIVQQYIKENFLEIPVTRCIVYETKPLEQRTCKWFSPGVGLIKDGTAEMSSEYGFDRAHPWPICSNPELIKASGRVNPTCEAEEIQGQCSYYEPEPVKLVRAINLTMEDAEALIVEVKTTRFGYGSRKYIVSHAPAGAPGVIDFEITSIDHKFELDQVLEEKLAELITNLAPVNMEEIPIDEAVAKKNRYFDYVLEG